MILEKLSDQWQTPQWLFDSLNKEFEFEVDVCATEYNNKCDMYIEDASKPWDCCSAFDFFMNPPYSNSLPFVKRAYEESLQYCIVCLLKVDPSTKWWDVFWDYRSHRPKAGCEVRFLDKRVKFDPPSKEILEKYITLGSEKDKKLASNLLAGKITTPAFPSAIVVMDRRYIIL